MQPNYFDIELASRQGAHFQQRCSFAATMKLLRDCCSKFQCIKDTSSLFGTIIGLGNFMEPQCTDFSLCEVCKLPPTDATMNVLKEKWLYDIYSGNKDGYERFIVPNSNWETEGIPKLQFAPKNFR